MKVYVVTEGRYSDYGIVQVFLNKEKAENYVKYNRGDWNDMQVEEYDTYDDNWQMAEDTYYEITAYVNLNEDYKHRFIPVINLIEDKKLNSSLKVDPKDSMEFSWNYLCIGASFKLVKYYMILIYVWFYEFSDSNHKQVILNQINKLI